MALFTVDQDKCKKDGICAEVCPMRIIAFDEDQGPRPVSEAAEICIECGHCVAVCPVGALDHRAMAAANCPPIKKADLLGPEQAERFLRSRRSIRRYKDQPVERDQIRRLIEIASHAPSGHNRQPVRWLVIDDAAELKRLAGITADFVRWLIENMPQVALAAHMDRVVAAWDAGLDAILRDAPAVVAAYAHKDDRMAVSSSIIALAYLELAAQPLGLGACWAGFFMAAAANFPPMQQALALPEGQQVFGAMMIGKPVYRYQRLPLRKKPDISFR